jgi:hypothetical protein
LAYSGVAPFPRRPKGDRLEFKTKSYLIQPMPFFLWFIN